MIEIRNPCPILSAARGYTIGNRAFDDVDMYNTEYVSLPKSQTPVASGMPLLVISCAQNMICMYVDKALLPYFTEFLDSVPFGNAKRVKKEKIDVIMHGCMVITFTCSGRQELTNQLFVG